MVLVVSLSVGGDFLAPSCSFLRVLSAGCTAGRVPILDVVCDVGNVAMLKLAGGRQGCDVHVQQWCTRRIFLFST